MAEGLRSATQLSGEEHKKVEKLRARYTQMAELVGPDLLQEFMKEAIGRLGEKAPHVRDHLLKELMEKGILKVDAESADCV